MRTPVLISALLLACGSPQMDPPQNEPPNNDPPKTQSVTLKGAYTLAPGEERYQCFITPFDRAGGAAIRRIVPKANHAAVHHIGVFSDPLKGEKLPTRECKEMGIWGFVFGGGVGTGALEMPKGTAMELEDGVPLILQIHYLNASDKPVEATATVDLELQEEGQSYQKVGSFIVGTTRISINPMQEGEAQGTCTKHPPLANTFLAFPHMHRLGTSMRITTGNDNRMVFDLPNWDFGDQGMYPVGPAMNLAENQPITTRCTYKNTTDQPVRFGLHTGDEMCVTVLYYWPAVGTPGIALCQK